MEEYLGLYIRTTYQDGRVLEGTIVSLDPHNRRVLLRNATESKSSKPAIVHKEMLVKGADLVDLEILSRNPNPEPIRQKPSSNKPKHTHNLYLNDRTPVPINLVSNDQITHVFQYSSSKYGPNAVQMIENGARSLVELLQHEHSCLFSESKQVLFLCGMNRIGAMLVALARHLTNRGVVCIVFIDRNVRNSDPKYIEFQETIASIHTATIIDDLTILSKHDRYRQDSFDLIIDGLSDQPSMKKNLRQWIRKTKTETIWIHGESRTLLDHPKSIRSIVFPGLPSLDFLKTLRNISPRFFLIDLGISPQLLVKLNLANDIPSLSKLYQEHGYTELSR